MKIRRFLSCPLLLISAAAALADTQPNVYFTAAVSYMNAQFGPVLDALKREGMVISMQDERWRLTLWHNRADNTIHATELYDEAGDPHETVSLAAKPDYAALIADLSKILPPPVSASSMDEPPAKARGKKKAA